MSEILSARGSVEPTYEALNMDPERIATAVTKRKLTILPVLLCDVPTDMGAAVVRSPS
jgi:hypothetical protein